MSLCARFRYSCVHPCLDFFLQPVQRVINDVIQNPSVTLSVETLQAWLNVPMDAAQRILARLASSGLMRELNNGVWVRGTLPGAQPNWY